MTMEEIEAQLKLLDWRDKQMLEATCRLERELPKLLEDLESYVKSKNFTYLLRSDGKLSEHVSKAILEWEKKQRDEIMKNAAKALEGTLGDIGKQLDLGLDPWDPLSGCWSAVAGVTLLAATIAAVPIVAPVMTVSAGILGIFGATTVSIPALTAGSLGISASALVSSTSVSSGTRKMRRKTIEKIGTGVKRRVLGIGAPPDEESLLNICQAAILAAAERSIEESDDDAKGRKKK